MRNLNLVFFFSEGAPHDNGLPLSKNKSMVLDKSRDYFNVVNWYTPRKLRNLGYSKYVKEYDDSGLVSRNPGMSKIGFCAWRPLILLLELDKMEYGDVLVYRDSNISKYEVLGDYENIDKIVDKCLDICGFDFFVPHHPFHIQNKNLTKTNILRELGGDHPFSYEFPALMSGFIIIRKSDISIALLNEWLVACENDSWINGVKYGDLDSSFSHSTPEQSILSVIISNWIRKRKYNIPLQYPNIAFSCKSIKSIKFRRDFSYLGYLDYDFLSIVKVPRYLLEDISIIGYLTHVGFLIKKCCIRIMRSVSKRLYMVTGSKGSLKRYKYYDRKLFELS